MTLRASLRTLGMPSVSSRAGWRVTWSGSRSLSSLVVRKRAPGVAPFSKTTRVSWLRFQAFEPGVLPVCRIKGHDEPGTLGSGEVRKDEREVMLVLRSLVFPFERQLDLRRQKWNTIGRPQDDLLDRTGDRGFATELPRAVQRIIQKEV